MKRLLFVLIFSLATATLIQAECVVRRRVISHAYTPSYTTHHATVTVKKAVTYDDSYDVIRIVPVATFVPIPLYAGAYPGYPAPVAPTAPATVPAAPTGSSEMRQVLEALKGFDARLKALETGKTYAPAPREALPPPGKEEASIPPLGKEKGPLTVSVINGNKCAICHAKALADEYGKGFVISDNTGIVRFSDKELLALTSAVYKGTMPKVKDKRAEEAGITALTDEEAGIWMAEIERQSRLNKTEPGKKE